MADVVVDISVSVDGLVTGPDAGPARGRGTGDEPSHTWAFEGDEDDRHVLESAETAVPIPLEQVAAGRTATATHLTYRPRR